MSEPMPDDEHTVEYRRGSERWTKGDSGWELTRKGVNEPTPPPVEPPPEDE